MTKNSPMVLALYHRDSSKSMISSLGYAPFPRMRLMVQVLSVTIAGEAFRDLRAVLLIILLRNARHVTTSLFCNVSWATTLTTGLLGLLAGILFRFRRHEPKSISKVNFIPKHEPEKFLRPLIFPCRTTHTRLFPTKHSFSYSYLFVGIPIGWHGPAGSILSADSGSRLGKDKSQRRTWFSVEAKDYLERGSHPDGLQGKLRDYISTQGISKDKYPSAFLVTAPRFLGFSFNPVSFWYLYDEDKKLGAMILEVNNTFDERRMYFMERSEVETGVSEELGKFRQAWDKDFHVSPFNDRQGGYSLAASDPFDSSTPELHQADNTIVLKSEDGKAKLVARVYSTQSALEAGSMTKMQTLAFVARWWWVGFMTNPRILREARVLWLKKLQVFYRPEVFVTSIGKNETDDESIVESIFQQILTHLVEQSFTPIKYVAAAGPMRAKAQFLKPANGKNDHDESCIELRILTPAFYSQLTSSTTILEAFERSFFKAEVAEKMVHISKPAVFKEILDAFSVPQEPPVSPNLAWKLLTCLRKASTVNQIPAHFAAHSLNAPTFNISELDNIVLKSYTSRQVAEYRNAALRIVLADRIAFGLPSLLSFYWTVIWLIYIYFASVVTERLFSVAFKKYMAGTGYFG